MLNDINFGERPSRERNGTFGDIYIAINTGAKIQYTIPEATAAKLLKQLGEILGRRWEKQRREELGHVVEPPQAGGA